jgi:hypothetical protein
VLNLEKKVKKRRKGFEQKRIRVKPFQEQQRTGGEGVREQLTAAK